MLAIGLTLEDVDVDDGSLLVIPGSHKGPVLSHLVNGLFAGAVDPADPLFDRDRIVDATGKAGLDDGPPLPHAARLGAEPVGPRAPDLLLEICAADAWPLVGF